MSAVLVARRYAKALMNVMQGDLGKAKSIAASMETLKELFDNKDAGNILRSPAMPVDLKRNLLQYGATASGAGDELKAFCEAVIDGGRVSLLPEIIDVFQELIEDAEGIIEANIYSATELDSTEKQAIEGTVAQLIGKKLKTTTHIDESLLGGFTVDVGNYKIDMSLKKKIEGLAQAAALAH